LDGHAAAVVEGDDQVVAVAEGVDRVVAVLDLQPVVARLVEDDVVAVAGVVDIGVVVGAAQQQVAAAPAAKGVVAGAADDRVVAGAETLIDGEGIVRVGLEAVGIGCGDDDRKGAQAVAKVEGADPQQIIAGPDPANRRPGTG
jgi:hypothetical protein